MKLLSLLHVVAGMTAVGGLLVKKKKASKQDAAMGLLIVRGDADDDSEAVCSEKNKIEHTDGLKISVRCCLMLETVTGGNVTLTSQGKTQMLNYGGEIPGNTCSRLRGLQAKDAADFCDEAPTLGLNGPMFYKLCPTPADAAEQKTTGCLVNEDWVWTNKECDLGSR